MVVDFEWSRHHANPEEQFGFTFLTAARRQRMKGSTNDCL
jgi:hypothetical protein